LGVPISACGDVNTVPQHDGRGSVPEDPDPHVTKGPSPHRGHATATCSLKVMKLLRSSAASRFTPWFQAAGYRQRG
jgi:hypothetical protein